MKLNLYERTIKWYYLLTLQLITITYSGCENIEIHKTDFNILLCSLFNFLKRRQQRAFLWKNTVSKTSFSTSAAYL